MQLSKRKIVSVIILVLIYFVFLLFWGFKQYINCRINTIKEISMDFFLDNMLDNENYNIAMGKSDEIIDYVAVLEIPKIGLKQGLVDIDSIYNNVNYNISIHELSSMPDKEKGNFILMAHSGSSNVSFFKNLNMLSIDDEVYVYYNKMLYKYLVYDIYEEDKIGVINVSYNDKTAILTMTTCSDNKDKQLIVIAKLQSKKEV